MTTPEELDALQQRLLSRDKSRHGYSGHPLYNRDGPEASGAITALRARVAELDAATDQLQYIASANATRAEKAEAGGPLIEYIRADLATPAPVVPAEGLEDYDAGLLNDFGGGDVGWWQDYLRAEIGRANEFWREQVENVTALRSAPPRLWGRG